jgi:hypothetical protein
MLTALPVAQLRAQAGVLAREIRELDVRIQRRVSTETARELFHKAFPRKCLN